MKKLSGDLDRAGLGHAADIVAAQIEQHQMLGALLGVGHQFLGQGGVLLRRRRRADACPAMGRMVTLPSRRRTRISGLEPTIEKPGKER